MWYKSETVGDRPANIDAVSSKTTVFVRKNFSKTYTESGDTKWEYLEQKISKDDWQVYTQIINMNESVEDLNNAVIELANLIGG